MAAMTNSICSTHAAAFRPAAAPSTCIACKWRVRQSARPDAHAAAAAHTAGPHHAGEEEQLSLRLQPRIYMQHPKSVRTTNLMGRHTRLNVGKEAADHHSVV